MVGGFYGILLQSAKRKAVRNALKRTSDTVWSNGRISPYFCERPIATASVWSKRLARHISRVMHCTRRGIWKGDIMVADIEELEKVDASELHARRLNAKEVLTPQRSGNFIFPVADGTVKIFGGERRLRTSTITPDRQER